MSGIQLLLACFEGKEKPRSSVWASNFSGSRSGAEISDPTGGFIGFGDAYKLSSLLNWEGE